MSEFQGLIISECSFKRILEAINHRDISNISEEALEYFRGVGCIQNSCIASNCKGCLLDTYHIHIFKKWIQWQMRRIKNE